MGRRILASADVVNTISGSAPQSERIFISEPIIMAEEPVHFWEFPELKDKGPLIFDGAANRLRPGDEYIVALKRVDFEKGAFSPEHDGRVYIYTDMLCSAFPCGREPVYYKYASDEWDQDDPVLYKDVFDADYVGANSILGSAKYLYEQMVEYFGQENFD